jgi:anti-anti-sigma factor
MKFTVEQLSSEVTKVDLDGPLDSKGTGAIDVQFADVANAKKSVVVDLSKVNFVASIGIRTLLIAAKAVQMKGRKLVLLSPVPSVENALRVSGIADLIPIFISLDAAIDAVAP